MVSFAKSMPPRTQWAIDRLVKAARSEGYTAVQVGMNWEDGQTGGHASLYGPDGAQEFYWNDGESWTVYGEVG